MLVPSAKECADGYFYSHPFDFKIRSLARVTLRSCLARAIQLELLNESDLDKFHLLQHFLKHELDKLTWTDGFDYFDVRYACLMHLSSMIVQEIISLGGPFFDLVFYKNR